MADPSIQDLVRQEAIRQGFPPEYALAVAERESGFDPTKPGTSGELGVMQLMPDTAKRYKVNAADPIQNISGGVQYLRYLMDRFNGDREKVFAAYNAGEGRATQPPASTQQYVQDVLRLVQKYQANPPTPTTLQESPASPSGLYGRAAVGQAFGNLVRGFNPMTPEGQRNLAGAAGSLAANAALTAVLPQSAPVRATLWGVRALRTLTPIAGAYMGGAAAQGVQDVAAGGPPSPTSMMQAGGEQARMEAGGQAVGWVGRAGLRRIMASGISQKISQGLQDALDAVGGQLQQRRPSISPTQAGQLVEAVAQGPAKAVKDDLGQAVEAAAVAGPPIAAQPLRDRLEELSQQVTPAISHEVSPQQASQQALAAHYTENPRLSPATVAERRQQVIAPVIPTDHPLPATLKAVETALADHDTISFEDAHKIKRVLDDAVNWDSPAKKQVQQITKGFRQTLRSEMASHQPYNDATEAYADVAKLYTKPVQQLHREILSNPEGIVKAVKWTNPSQAKMLKELTVDTAAQAGSAGAQQGEAAWNALRAAWTNENLIAAGPAQLASRIRQIEASNSGQQFVQTMYGDPQGQTVWNNLKRLGARFEEVQGAIKGFAGTDLSRATSPAGVVRDIGYAVLPGHSITKVGAAARAAFGQGAAVKDMLQWAAYSDARTQFVIRHILTGPNVGQAVADFSRWVQNNEDVDKPMASHATPPPKPQSLVQNVQQ